MKNKVSYLREVKSIVALSTPAGKGAIGIIRISGPDCLNVVSKNLPTIKKWEPRKAILTKFQEANGNILDEVLLIYFSGPHSYTGEDVIEISFHGSPFILESAINEIIKNGAVLASPGEFTQRAFLNGKLDLVQAEAVGDLIASESRSAHMIAMSQMKGNVSKILEELRQKLIDFAALIELELDFTEEDVEFANRAQLSNLITELKLEIQKMINSFNLGNAIKSGIPLIIVGEPNAGKSTLLNRFLEDDRALVTDIAGTTRDSIEERFRLGDHLFRITDTAGLRKSNDKVEKLGIERSWRLMSEGHIILFLIDPITSVKKNILELEKDIKLRAPSAHLVKILTKSDLWNGENYHLDYPECIEIGIGCGLSQIKSKLSSIIDKTEWNGNSEILIANIRHAKALKTALDSILKAEKCLHDDSSGEIISYELRDALESLGSITGEIIADDLLSSVFSRFCIGK